MSLLGSLSALAPSIMQALGSVRVTFRRTALGEYDPISGNTTPSTVTEWSAIATVVQNAAPTTNPSESFPVGTGQRRLIRTLLVSGFGIEAPRAADTVVMAGVEYRVSDVSHVGAADAVTVPLYRVECAS